MPHPGEQRRPVTASANSDAVTGIPPFARDRIVLHFAFLAPPPAVYTLATFDEPMAAISAYERASTPATEPRMAVNKT